MAIKNVIFFVGILTTFIAPISLPGQSGFNDTGKLASLCKVWGMLKYYHPVVAKGNIDWDNELITKIPVVLQARNKDELSKVYSTWINGLGNIDEFYASQPAQTVTESNKFLTWRYDTVYFNATMDTLLNFVFEHRGKEDNFYVRPVQYTGQAEFTNEQVYNDPPEPSKEMRLLALFRYWNMIEYYYPSKYLIGENWQNVLTAMIPDFYYNNKLPYPMALHELVASIHDSHGMLTPLDSFKNNYYCASFMVKIIDDKAIVSRLIQDSLTQKDDIRYGDILTAINDSSLVEYLAPKKKYISASNDAVILRNAAMAMVCGYTDTTRMTFERNGQSMTKTVHRDTAIMSKRKALNDTTQPVFKILENDIGYINMGRLTMDMVKEAYHKVENKKAVIFDVRNYPKGTMYEICSLFGSSSKPFVKFTEPDFSCPGTFKWTNSINCGPVWRKKGIKRKIVVLINEQTQSHAEFTCMSFKTLPNVTFIGSQTAGADGNVSLIAFPGGYKTYMSGLGVYYPDCTVTQRVGIVPDIEVKPTIKGIQEHRDEVLERAITFINSGK